MQAFSSTWSMGHSQLSSLGGLVSNGYEAVPQDPTGFTHSAVYSFVDSDEFIYDGNEWDDDLTRGGSDAKTKGRQSANTNPGSNSSSGGGLDRWGDYAGSWEKSDNDDDNDDDESAASASRSQSQHSSPRQGPHGASSHARQGSPRAIGGGSPKSRSTTASGGGFWGLFTKQRQQRPRVEPLRRMP